MRRICLLCLVTVASLVGCDTTNTSVPSDEAIRQSAPSSHREPLRGNFGNDPFWTRAPGDFAPPAGFQREYEQERAKRIALEKQLATERAKKQQIQRTMSAKSASRPVQ